MCRNHCSWCQASQDTLTCPLSMSWQLQAVLVQGKGLLKYQSGGFHAIADPCVGLGSQSKNPINQGNKVLRGWEWRMISWVSQAEEQKLLDSLRVWQQKRLFHLPEGRRVNRLWLGCCFSQSSGLCAGIPSPIPQMLSKWLLMIFRGIFLCFTKLL